MFCFAKDKKFEHACYLCYFEEFVEQFEDELHVRKKHGTLNTGIEGSKVVVFYETNLHGRGCMYTLTSRCCDV